VVGRLVEQQHVGIGDERAAQEHTPLGAGGEPADIVVAVQPQLTQRFRDAALGLPVARPRADRSYPSM
jgi:hypothetical protein